jgi:hypothetical protein
LEECELLRAIWAGIAAGISLGLLLKAIEFLWQIRLYTLLLSVEYVPVLRDLPMSELSQLTLHILISVVVALVFYRIIQQKARWSNLMLTFTVWGVIIGVLLYPTTLLSANTPSLYDGKAILVWLIGHALYGLVLAFIMNKGRSVYVRKT